MIKGTLHAVVSDTLTGKSDISYVFGAQAVTLACDPPLGELMWATIDGGVLTDFVRIPGEAAPVNDRVGLRVALLRVVQDSRLQDDGYRDEEFRKAAIAAEGVQNWFRSKGWRFWDFRCEPFLLPRRKGEPLPHRSVWCEGMIDRLYEESEDFRSFDATHFHLWGNNSLEFCGFGQWPGRYSMSFSGCYVRTMCHEIGHNLGLGHSRSEHNGKIAEYGNNFCIMGRSGFGLSGAQSLKLGINTEREHFTLNKSRRFLMAPIEGSEDDLHPGMYQAVRFSRGSRNYVLAMHRSKSGYSLMLEHDGKKPIRLHQLRTPGSVVSVEDVTVTLEQVRDGYALVNVDMNDGLGNQSVAIPDGLPPAVAPIEPNPQHEGIWWNPLLSGQGFDLRGDTFSWYTFNPRKFNLEKHASQRWFRCKLSGTGCDIYTGTKDGGLVVCGSGRLSFMDDDHGIFQYRIRDEAFDEGVRNGSVWIERLTAKSGGSVSEEGSVRRSVYYHGDTRIELVQDFREPPTDYLGRQIEGPVYQRWVLNTGGRAVTARDGRFMESITPEFVPLGEK